LKARFFYDLGAYIMQFSENLLVGLLRAKRVVIFTGAGMSAESGILTFRDAQTGLWKKYDAHKLASPDGYRADKALVWGWYEWCRWFLKFA
jgi:NAD-dependent deacetylase